MPSMVYKCVQDTHTRTHTRARTHTVIRRFAIADRGASVPFERLMASLRSESVPVDSG